MGLPWQQVENTDVIAWMAVTPPPGWRCPRSLADVEARAVVLSGLQKAWPAPRLAERWGLGKSQAYEIVGAAQRWAASLSSKMSATEGDRKSLEKTGNPSEDSGMATASGRHNSDAGRKNPEGDRKKSEASRARVLSGEIKTKTEQDPDAGDARAGQADEFSGYARGSALAEVWREEREAMPPELRGKSPGNDPPWDLDLLEAGPVDAEEALRALAELCRGTAARAPRVFEWSQLLGPGSRGLAGCWRDALAWKRGVGGEPAIGRAWRGGDGRNGAAGAGAGNSPARSRKGAAVIIGQGKHDPYDDGWGDAAPGEREAAEKAFAEWTAKQEAARAAGAVPPGGASR